MQSKDYAHNEENQNISTKGADYGHAGMPAHLTTLNTSRPDTAQSQLKNNISRQVCISVITKL